MTVKIGNYEIDHILEAGFVESSKVAIPNWVNQFPEIDANIWSRSILQVEYIIRADETLKRNLYGLFISHALISLDDTTYGISSTTAWINSWEQVWDDRTKMWRITMEIYVATYIHSP